MGNLSASRQLGRVVAICLLLHWVDALTVKDLYPFGSQDETLSKEQDVSSAEIALSVPIVHYSDTFGSIYVSIEC